LCDGHLRKAGRSYGAPTISDNQKKAALPPYRQVVTLAESGY